MAYEFEMDVFDGTVITVEFETTGCDNTDCGGGVNDVDGWTITRVSGKPTATCPEWLVSHIRNAYSDYITERCYAHLSDY